MFQPPGLAGRRFRGEIANEAIVTTGQPVRALRAGCGAAVRPALCAPQANPLVGRREFAATTVGGWRRSPAAPGAGGETGSPGRRQPYGAVSLNDTGRHAGRRERPPRAARFRWPGHSASDAGSGRPPRVGRGRRSARLTCGSQDLAATTVTGADLVTQLPGGTQITFQNLTGPALLSGWVSRSRASL